VSQDSSLVVASARLVGAKPDATSTTSEIRSQSPGSCCSHRRLNTLTSAHSIFALWQGNTIKACTYLPQSHNSVIAQESRRTNRMRLRRRPSSSTLLHKASTAHSTSSTLSTMSELSITTSSVRRSCSKKPIVRVMRPTLGSIASSPVPGNLPRRRNTGAASLR
jgi:hypothetical protein